MYQRSTNRNRLDLKIWQNMPDWCIAELSEDLYATRMGFALTEPKEVVAFEDSNIKLCSYYTEAKKVLGYTLLAKDKFGVSKRTWHVALLNPKAAEHHSPKVVYKDAQLHLHRFNDIDPSYWMVIRWRTPK